MDHNNFNNNSYTDNTNSNSYPGTGQGGYTGYQNAGSSGTNQANTFDSYYSAPTPPKKHKNKGGFGKTLAKTTAIAVVFGLIGGGIFTGTSYVGTRALGLSGSARSTESSSSSNTTVVKTATGNAGDLIDVASITQEVMPSIVAITNTAITTTRSFWGTPSSHESESAGSGIIISQSNEYLYIASNNHVVANAESLSVQFSNGTVANAEIRGTVPSDDLAVVQVKLSDIDKETLSVIKVATIASEDSYPVGSSAIAIGNALGYGQSVTTGVISALGRSVSSQDKTTGQKVTNSNLIQTDAAINPGNSGGALLNASGEVIGINSVKYASTAVEGIGYAIPMTDAMPILEQLISDGSYIDTHTAYLGIKGGDVTAEMIGYNYPEGVYVASVAESVGAGAAGIQEGDVIISVDGTAITGMSDLQDVLQKHKAGEEIKVKVSRQAGRGFEEKEFTVTLVSAGEMQ